MSGDPRADAIVVLGHRVEPDGRPGFELSKRLERGLELLQAARAPLLVCSGGRDPDEPTSAAEAMIKVAVASGVDGRCLVAASRPLTTLEEAITCSLDLSRPRGWRRLLLVTSDYHVPRAVFAFALAHGPGVEIVAEPVRGTFGDPLHLVRREAEGLACLRSLAEGLAPGDLAGLIDRSST